MPGTAAKKYEEGIFMKKIVKGILLLAAAAAVVTGCSRIGMGGAEAPTENSVYVAGDGSVRWASVETYQQGSYTEDELKNSAGQKIIDFNSGLGKAASYENAEGSEKLPVAIVSASMGNGTATLVTEYDAPGRLIEFAQEIGDYNVPFTQLDTGRVAAMSGELAEVSFRDEKGKAVDQETGGQGCGTGRHCDGEKNPVCKRGLRPEGFQPGADFRRGNQLHHIKVILII